MARRPMKDVIVLLPGILGSELRQGSRLVWSTSPRGLLTTLATADASARCH